MGKRSLENDEDTYENLTKKISSNVYDDKTIVPNIMEMTPENRSNTIEQNPILAFGYPSEYNRIYEQEKSRRNYVGFENLKNVSNEKIFVPGPDQRGSTVIKQHRNVNCFKSRFEYKDDYDRIKFGNKTKNLLMKYGIDYYNDQNDFENRIYEGDYEYEDFEQILNGYPNKYKIIILVLREVFAEYKDYICIAGGFSLTNYIKHNYNYDINFSDIDLFIHSCNQETANEIIKKLYELCGSDIYENENVISGVNFGHMNYFDNYQSEDYENDNKIIKVQIIKRLYSCPQEIIAGFDIDCCCILTTLDNQTFVTERGYNAIKNGYNVINFEKLSPSYEYRLCKYNKRGFGMWLPFMEHFKENAFFDANILDKTKGSTIIMRQLMKIRTTKDFYRSKKITPEYVSDYGEISGKRVQFPVEFKSLNPNEQRINTFHRIFLEDPKEWYPEYPENGIDYFKYNEYDDEIIDIDESVEFSYTLAKNIKRDKKLKLPNDRIKYSSRKLINYITYLAPDSVICGELASRAITGVYNTELSVNIWTPGIISNYEENIFRYNIVKYRALLYFGTILETIHDIKIDNVLELGTIVCVKNIEDSLAISDEESLINFSKNNYYGKIYHYYGRDDSKNIETYSYKIVIILRGDVVQSLIENTRSEHKKYLDKYINPYKFGYNDEVRVYMSKLLNIKNVPTKKNRKLAFDYLSIKENRDLVYENLKRDVYYLTNIYAYIDIDFQDGSKTIEQYIFDSDTTIDGIMYTQGKFIGQENNYHKEITGVRDDNVEILPYPIYENYIPV